MEFTRIFFFLIAVRCRSSSLKTIFFGKVRKEVEPSAGGEIGGTIKDCPKLGKLEKVGQGPCREWESELTRKIS